MTRYITYISADRSIFDQLQGRYHILNYTNINSVTANFTISFEFNEESKVYLLENYLLIYSMSSLSTTFGSIYFTRLKPNDKFVNVPVSFR